ncbi:hypothetical protein BDW67DRAFT_22576 [Aspergillus spinulosporus]
MASTLILLDSSSSQTVMQGGTAASLLLFWVDELAQAHRVEGRSYQFYVIHQGPPCGSLLNVLIHHTIGPLTPWLFFEDWS